MKFTVKTAFYLFTLAAAVLFSGCTPMRISNGKYETVISGREDFAAAYGDLIFLRLRAPGENGSDGSYWEWAGKYKLDDDGRILLNMDDKKLRDWSFHFDLYYRQNSIVISDLSSEEAFTLHFRPAVPGSRPAPRRQQKYNSIQGEDFSTYR